MRRTKKGSVELDPSIIFRAKSFSSLARTGFRTLRYIRLSVTADIEVCADPAHDKVLVKLISKYIGSPPNEWRPNRSLHRPGDHEAIARF